MERFDRIFTTISNRMALYASGLILLIMILYVSGNVFSRYVLRMGGIEGCYTYVGTLMIPLIYFGLAYGWYKKAYITVDILQVKMNDKAIWVFQFTFLLITLVLFSGLLAEGSLMETISSFAGRNRHGVPGVFTPEWPWKATVFIGFFMMSIRIIFDLITMVKTGKLIPNDRGKIKAS